MASVLKAKPILTNALQQRVVTLDRSKDRCSVQVVEACNVVGVDAENISAEWSQHEADKEARHGFGPKEEWVLRWLLKRFDEGEPKMGSLCLEPKAWILARIMVARLPTTVAARLLSAHKFIHVLEKVFRWLDSAEDIAQSLALSIEDPHTLQTTTSRESSSSATVQEVPTNIGKKLGKRKRGCLEPESHETEYLSPPNKHMLHLSICSTVKQVEVHTNTICAGMDGFAAEHMKSALRTSTDQSARILGRAIGSLRHILQIKLHKEQMKGTEIHDTLLRPIVDIWDMQTTSFDNTDRLSNAQSFSTECLVPALRLLADIKAPLINNPIIANCSKALETLSTVHTLLPGRTAFQQEKKRTGADNESSHSVIEILLRPLFQTLSQEAMESSPVIARSTIAAIPILFNVAIKCFPRITPKQRMTEDPWLQELFLQLAKCASLSLPLSEPVVREDDSLDMLEQMLHIVIEHNLKLKVSILESIILHLSGVDKVNLHSKVRWGLISLSIEIDPYLLVAIPIKESTSDIHLASQGNLALASILVKISSCFFIDGANTPLDYAFVLQHIIIPLVNDFVRARDLLGFIQLWKQQVMLWETYKPTQITQGICSEYAVSIWEDEALSQNISDKLESALTIGQIIKSLQDIDQVVAASLFEEAAQSGAGRAATIALDCMVNGIRTENTAAGVNAQLETLVDALLSSGNDSLSAAYDWRVWRILSTISRRWPEKYSRSRTALLEKRVQAQRQLVGIVTSPSGPQQPILAYDRALFGFAFLIASSEGHRDSGNDPLSLAIRVIIDSMKVYADKAYRQTNYDHVPAFGPVWDSRSSSIATQDSLVLACALELVLANRLWENFPQELLVQFFGQLYRCASCHSTARKPQIHLMDDNNLISYYDVWQEVLRSPLIQEDILLARFICQILTRNLLEHTEVEELGIGMTTTTKEYAISCLWQMPFNILKRNERNMIVQYLASRLLSRDHPPRQCAYYMIFLVHCLQHPSKSIQLLSEPCYLWNLVSVLDLNSAELLTADSIHALRHLTSRVLELGLERSIENKEVEFLDPYLVELTTQVTGTKSTTLRYAATLLISVSLNMVLRCWERLPVNLRTKHPSLPDMYEKHFDRLLDYLNTSSDALVGFMACPLLECMCTNIDVVERSALLVNSGETSFNSSNQETRHARVSRYLQLVEMKVSEQRALSSIEETSRHSLEDTLILVQMVKDRVSRSMTKQTCTEAGVIVLSQNKRLQACEDEKSQSATIANCAVHTPRARQLWLQHWDDWFFKSEDKSSALRDLVNQTESNIDDLDKLLYLRILLNRSYHFMPKDPSGDIKSELARLFSTLCGSLNNFTNTKTCITGMRCLDILMKKHTKIISQWHIDSLLSAITIIASSSGPQLGREASNIFTGLTRLFGTVLANHRSKLGGRYHLVVLALQGLLRCLFTPYDPSLNNTQLQGRAPWLKEVKLDDEHATNYARLLTSICDPTVSAVTMSKNRHGQELNDETKRARSIAGQHLQYLIMEFCQCQLHGRMEPTVRTALLPGLYAVFDAMTQEIMRTVNSALDSSGRAIFKSLYDDYRRFGRWKGA